MRLRSTQTWFISQNVRATEHNDWDVNDVLLGILLLGVIDAVLLCLIVLIVEQVVVEDWLLSKGLAFTCPTWRGTDYIFVLSITLIVRAICMLVRIWSQAISGMLVVVDHLWLKVLRHLVVIGLAISHSTVVVTGMLCIYIGYLVNNCTESMIL